jgi:hypothetical protein
VLRHPGDPMISPQGGDCFEAVRERWSDAEI